MKPSHIVAIFFFLVLCSSLKAMEQQSIIPKETNALIALLLAPASKTLPKKLPISLMEMVNQQEKYVVMPELCLLEESNCRKVSLEDMLKPLSHFKQQLSYHDRLTVDANANKIVIDEDLIKSRQDTLNFLAQNLLIIAKVKSKSSKPSSWVFKADHFSYILYPLHLAIRHGLDTCSHFVPIKVAVPLQEDIVSLPIQRDVVKANAHDIAAKASEATVQDIMFKCVKVLLSEGANPNAKDHLGRTPLHILSILFDPENKAQRNFQVTIASFLSFRSAQIDAPNNQGDTPLTCAAQAGATKLVRTLLEIHANPNIHVDAEEEGTADIYACGMSPLWAAASQNRVSAIYLLLEYKAKIKASELQAAQLLHDTTGDQIKKRLLKQVIATRH